MTVKIATFSLIKKCATSAYGFKSTKIKLEYHNTLHKVGKNADNTNINISRSLIGAKSLKLKNKGRHEFNLLSLYMISAIYCVVHYIIYWIRKYLLIKKLEKMIKFCTYRKKTGTLLQKDQFEGMLFYGIQSDRHFCWIHDQVQTHSTKFLSTKSVCWITKDNFNNRKKPMQHMATTWQIYEIYFSQNLKLTRKLKWSCNQSSKHIQLIIETFIID